MHVRGEVALVNHSQMCAVGRSKILLTVSEVKAQISWLLLKI